MSFDPARVRFEMWGSDSDLCGVTPMLRYLDGHACGPHTALEGLRYKYPFRDLGFIIKAEVIPMNYLLPTSYRTGQGQSEWQVWESLPDDLRPYFAPLLCHAWSPVGDRCVLWTAQEWVEGSVHVTRKECRMIEDPIRKYGYRIHDGGPRQMMRTAAGPILVDWGHWELPKYRH